MAFLIFGLFVAVPIIEIALFISVGREIGLFNTLALVVVTAVIGTWLLQAQGLAAVARTQAQLQAGEMPVEEVMTGFFLVIAGAFLLTPGFFTDALGFALFVPAFRRFVGRRALGWFMRHGTVHFSANGFTSRGPGNRSKDGVIDGEYDDITPDSAPPEEPPRLR